MDLGSHSSPLDSVTDHELVAPEGLENLGETGSKIKNNDKCHVDDKLSEGFGSSLSPSVTTKGRGLKKWRRMHRDGGKSANTKRNSRQRSDGSVSTKNAMVNGVDSREESENSMDGSSRSSTAASAPRMRHEMLLPVVGQQGKGQSVIRKKARGVKIDKENSHSSSRSPNFVFIHSNGRQSGRDADDNKEAPTESEALAAEKSWEVQVKEENGDDVLAVSMMKFHSAQEAIEREVQKLKDVGKEDPLLDDSIQPSDPTNLGAYEPRSSEELHSNSWKQNVGHGDLKTELEEILKQRIEVEVQCIAIQQYSKAGYPEVMVQQKKLASEHMEVMKKLECAESKARALKRQAEKVKVTCEEILEREEVLKLQNRVFRLSSCFTVQLIVVVLVVYLQFSSHHRKLLLVPT